MFAFVISVWPPRIVRKHYPVCDVIFDGWVSREIALQYKCYVSLFATESWDGRAVPAMAVYGIKNIDVRDEGSLETSRGATLRISYDPERCDIDAIEHFLREAGIIFHRTEVGVGTLGCGQRVCDQ